MPSTVQATSQPANDALCSVIAIIEPTPCDGRELFPYPSPVRQGNFCFVGGLTTENTELTEPLDAAPRSGVRRHKQSWTKDRSAIRRVFRPRSFVPAIAACYASRPRRAAPRCPQCPRWLHSEERPCQS